MAEGMFPVGSTLAFVSLANRRSVFWLVQQGNTGLRTIVERY
jgi:hypothetical protein